MPIDSTTAKVAGHHIDLGAGYRSLQVWEHVGPLRFFGITHVDVTSPFGLTPFFGRALEVLEAIEPVCAPTHAELPWYTVADRVSACYEARRGGYQAYTEIMPSKAPMLTLEVFCAYPGLGKLGETFVFPDNELLRTVCSAQSQGLPLYRLSRALPKWFWPHHNKFEWIQEAGDETLERFLLHRVQDLLGALSLLCMDGLFAAHVRSICSGHDADLRAVKKAFPLLRRL